MARPKGVKETAPRVRRQDVLNARREEWDKWERRHGVLGKVRRVLLRIIEDENTSTRDKLRAIEMIENRGLGKVAEEHEQPPVQVLQIIRPSLDGFERLNPAQTYEAVEVETSQPD